MLQTATPADTDSWGRKDTRCPWGMGPDLHLLAVGHVWAEGTAEDRSRGLGGTPSAGKLWVRASPVHTGAVFLLG